MKGRDGQLLVYRWLQSVYPRRFRQEYGREMALCFRERAAGTEAPRLWLEIIIDLLRTAPLERFAQFRGERSIDQEGVAMWKIVLGVLLLFFAAGNIVYDALEPQAAMGYLAILVTSAAAAAGVVLLRAGRRARSRQA